MPALAAQLMIAATEGPWYVGTSQAPGVPVQHKSCRGSLAEIAARSGKITNQDHYKSTVRVLMKLMKCFRVHVAGRPCSDNQER